MDRLVLSLLVENNPGVLNRVAGLFSRRGYNIESISVGQTNIKGMSRMTVVSTGDEQILTQIEKQLGKLVEVVEIEKLEPDDSVYRCFTNFINYRSYWKYKKSQSVINNA